MSATRPDSQTAFTTAVEMHQFGVEIMRQNLRRRDPAASPIRIEARLRKWLHARKGGIRSDGHERQIPWPRNAP